MNIRIRANAVRVCVLAAASVGTIGLSVGSATIASGVAAADTTLQIYGGQSSKFSCELNRRKDIVLFHREGDYYYGDCVQAPNPLLTGWAVGDATPGKWYFPVRAY